jgi:hypothetical protein
MAARDRVKAPGGLGIAGAALWRRLTADADLDFDSGSLLTLELACRQADDVALLEKMLADQGAVVSGSKGQPRLSGVLAELRQQRYALNRLVSAIGLPEDDAPVGKSPSQRKAQRAADARWFRQARAREARSGGSAQVSSRVESRCPDSAAGEVPRAPSASAVEDGVARPQDRDSGRRSPS